MHTKKLRPVFNQSVATLQGSSFACLPLLRDLCLRAETLQHAELEADEAHGGWDVRHAFIPVDLSGLPAGLRTFKVTPAVPVLRTVRNIGCLLAALPDGNPSICG